jgi:hypothetical protein
MNLLQFYRDWLDWAENDGTPGVFHPNYGLCYNLERWCEDIGRDTLSVQLENDFSATGHNINYPFGVTLYVRLQNAGKLHTQKRRLNWVRKRINELEKHSQPHEGT